MNYSVKEIVDFFAHKGIEVKQGTIEAYRSKLSELGLIGNHESINSDHLRILEQIVKEKTADETWSSLMSKHIHNAFSDKLPPLEFRWAPTTIVRHLAWAINHLDYKVSLIGSPSLADDGDIDAHILWDCIIENFVELGKSNARFKNSRTTDGNALNYKICSHNGDTFYLCGKYNPQTQQEDFHIFYAPMKQFNLPQLQYFGYFNESQDELAKNAIQTIQQYCTSDIIPPSCHEPFKELNI